MPSPSSEGRKRSVLGWLWRIALGLYLVLLAASHLVQALRPEVVPSLQSSGRFHELPAVDGDTLVEEKTVRLAYYEWAPETEGAVGAAATSDEVPVVVLLHGSPGDGLNFASMGPGLGQSYRVLAPSLPGFGDSTRKVPDYSIHAHALYVERWLEDLGIDEYHAVGFSLGGGVALHMAERRPERLRSLTLLSAIGLQEFELLGEYHLNHAVHGAQLAFFWLLQNAMPHFGRFEGTGVAYCRNFFDTDQRPLEGILKSVEMPFLIIHGEGDVLVPVEAAREHHRIVPQSELEVFDANHFMVFRRPNALNDVLRDFVERVEAGAARTRSTAESERLALAAEPRGPLPELFGIALVVWMLLIAVATFVTEDLTCLAAGLVVASGRVDFVEAVVACAVGIFLGDMLLYFAGRMGRRSLSVPPLSWIVKPEEIERSRRWFERRGSLVIFLSRFLPGTRLPTYVTAGILRMNPLWFAIQLFIPVALWTPILVGVAQVFGEAAFAQLSVFSRWALPGFVALLLAVWIFMSFGRRLLTHRGRRELVGKWRKTTTWEFWPSWTLYLPVALRMIPVALKHRSAMLFTVVNPGVPAFGGLVGESKSEILASLDADYVARFVRLEPGPLDQRATAVRTFMEENAYDFPIVLKPDQGERGSGVRIVESDDEIHDVLRAQPGLLIVQEYIPGVELGIFYMRHPDEEKGRIFAVTDKRLPEVEGDGKRTLTNLVLDDPRAVALNAMYIKSLGERADEIPATGERVRLVEVGTHCRGAIFLDGMDFVTPTLEETVDRLSKTYEGFYLGRYDLRAASHEAFGRGELKVLELNGVTSEATNIYDPRYSYFDAVGTLVRQWTLAFEIGAANRERGVQPATVREVLKTVLKKRS